MADQRQGSGSFQEGGIREETEEEVGKDVTEKDWHLNDDGNDSGLELVATRLSHHSVSPTTQKTESDSDPPLTEKQSQSKHTLPGSSSTSTLKRALPSHMQRSKGGRDNELAEAWLTANIAKNERKRKRDEMEQERLDRKFQQELELRRMEMAHEERMMEKKIELARLVKGSANDDFEG